MRSLLLIAILFCSMGAFAVDFTFDADAGKPGNFTSSTDSGAKLTSTATACGTASPGIHTGADNYQINAPGSANHYLTKSGLSYSSSIYLAYWVCWDSAFNWGTYASAYLRTASTYFVVADSGFSSGPQISFFHNLPSNVNDGAFSVTANAWHLVEMTCTGIGTSSGVFNAQIDGVSKVNVTAINWSAGYTITTLQLGIIDAFGGTAAGNMYFDDGLINATKPVVATCANALPLLGAGCN